MLKSWCSVLLISIISGAVSTAMGGQPLETESARLAARGTLKVEAGLERQTSADGSEANLPAALEYSPADRVEILVEPVVYTRIRDPHRTLASGPGDFEVTALMLARTEARWAPAVAFAAEVKIPTARSRFIGSGKPDYTVYSIASKQWGVWDTHLNLAYAWIGRPPGVRIQNVYGFAVAVEPGSGDSMWSRKSSGTPQRLRKVRRRRAARAPSRRRSAGKSWSPRWEDVSTSATRSP